MRLIKVPKGLREHRRASYVDEVFEPAQLPAPQGHQQAYSLLLGDCPVHELPEVKFWRLGNISRGIAHLALSSGLLLGPTDLLVVIHHMPLLVDRQIVQVGIKIAGTFHILEQSLDLFVGFWTGEVKGLRTMVTSTMIKEGVMGTTLRS